MIGVKKSGSTTICANISDLYTMDIDLGEQYSTSPLMITPFYGNIIPHADQGFLNSKVGLFSAFQDPNTRKLFTMFRQVRVKGMYVRITPLLIPSEVPYISCYTCWDRKAKYGNWDQFGTLNTSDASTAIKETCLAQNAARGTFGTEKGRFSLRTKCTPFGSEKGGWIDATCGMQSTWNAQHTETYWRIRLNRVYWQDQADTHVTFNPALFIAFEAPLTPTIATSSVFRIEVKYFLKFRVPGICQPTSVSGYFLKPNSEILPWTPSKTEEQEEPTEDPTQPKPEEKKEPSS